MTIKWMAAPRPPPHATYRVRFEIEVHAASPEEAAKIAHDMALDPDTPLAADVRRLDWCEEAWEWLAAEDRGWMVYFGDRWPSHMILGGDIKPYEGSAVDPIECIGWRRRAS